MSTKVNTERPYGNPRHVLPYVEIREPQMLIRRVWSGAGVVAPAALSPEKIQADYFNGIIRASQGVIYDANQDGKIPRVHIPLGDGKVLIATPERADLRFRIGSEFKRVEADPESIGRALGIVEGYGHFSFVSVSSQYQPPDNELAEVKKEIPVSDQILEMLRRYQEKKGTAN